MIRRSVSIEKSNAALCFAAVFVVVGFLGCARSDDHRSDVTGEVTFDGEPLEEGDILFEPEDGEGLPVAGKISDGQFSLRVPAGRKRVQILATREADTPDEVMGLPGRESIIPARYNDDTVLSEEVKAGAENHFRFELNGD